MSSRSGWAPVSTHWPWTVAAKLVLTVTSVRTRVCDTATNLRIDYFMKSGGRRVQHPVLVISYETFRLHAKVLHSEPVGIVICDEV